MVIANHSAGHFHRTSSPTTTTTTLFSTYYSTTSRHCSGHTSLTFSRSRSRSSLPAHPSSHNRPAAISIFYLIVPTSCFVAPVPPALQGFVSTATRLTLTSRLTHHYHDPLNRPTLKLNTLNYTGCQREGVRSVSAITYSGLVDSLEQLGHCFAVTLTPRYCLGQLPYPPQKYSLSALARHIPVNTISECYHQSSSFIAPPEFTVLHPTPSSMQFTARM